MQQKRSKITLKTYVDLLDLVSKGDVPEINDLKGADRRAANELLRSDLISDNDGENPEMRLIRPGRDFLAITPEGIAALSAWSEQLKTESFLHKAGDVLLRFLWVIIGAIAASIPSILK